MKFQSTNDSFVVLPHDTTKDMYGRRIADIRGLRAEFTGRMPKQFDSVVAQAQKGWSDEERLQVERYLLSHKQFGYLKTMDGGNDHDRQVGNIQLYVLYLGPGQDVPPEHREFVKDMPWYQSNPAIQGTPEDEPISTDLCAHRWLSPDNDEEVLACNKKALKGKLYCRQHLEVAAST